MWARLSLFVGTILKKRYANMRQVKSESLTSSYLDNASNHSGKQGQQRNQQIKTTNGVKTLYQRYYYWIVRSIDRVVQPVYWHINNRPQKQYQNSHAGTEDNSRNLEPLIHTHGNKSTTGKTNESTKREPNQKLSNSTFATMQKPRVVL
jgi:hypothetical protein